MDFQKRILRRPFATLLWLLLIAAMALLVGVSGVLLYGSDALRTTLDENNTTVALRTDKSSTSVSTGNGVIWSISSKSFSQEDMDALLAMDAVKDVYFHSLTGGYSPQFTPVLGLRGAHKNSFDIYPHANESYDKVFFVGTVLRILEGTDEFLPADYHAALGLGEQESSSTICLEVRLDEVLQAHPDYPLDGIVNCHLTLCGDAAINFFNAGGQYLFCGEYDPHASGSIDWPAGAIHPHMYMYGWNVLEEDTLLGNRLTTIDGVTERQTRFPVAVKLETDIQTFLADPENAQWTAYLDGMEQAQHSLPVIGTDCLKSMYLFVSNNAEIVAGRMFTQKEYDTGAKVCILSETVANRSGLQPGDTVLLSQFLCEETDNKSLDLASIDGMLNNPTIGEFAPDTAFATTREAFTVVGFYRQINEWEETSYSVTPNTVFIPRKAQIPGGFGSCDTNTAFEGVNSDGNPFTYTRTDEHGSYGVYLSVLLRNGYREEFLQSVDGTEFQREFNVYDQNYDSLIGILLEIVSAARKLLLFAFAGWFVLLMLYILLYQGSQRKNLGTMRSLGAAPRQVKSYLFSCGFALAAAGILIGTGVTAFLTHIVNDKLMGQMLEQSTLGEDVLYPMILESQMPPAALALFAVVQLAVFALALWLHTRELAKKSPRKLMGV